MGWWRDHFGTFGLWRRNKPEMIEDPRGTYLEDFSTSTDEFYSAIEAELVERRFPELVVTRERFREGGPLSARREYLRMRRERLVFDICAAPIGTSFYFSVRFAHIPVILYVWQLLIFCALLFAIFNLYWMLMGLFWGVSMFVLNVIAVFVLLRNAVALELHRLDDFLLRLPVFGIIYENFFRPETYARIDTRAMYVESIKRIVERKLDEVTGQSGVRLTDIESLQPRELTTLTSAFKRWAR